MKFLHTADWQIGMKAAALGDAGARVREERIAAGRRVVETAKNHNVDFVLVAGDLFEDNAVDRVLVQKVADMLSSFGEQVFIIPGNHDPFMPGSVWEHPSWKSASNVHVLLDEAPVEVHGGVLYPCPVREKHSGLNPTAWIPSERDERIRIGIAHGTVDGIRQDEPEYPIPRDAVQRAGLDFLALGHWHSYGRIQVRMGPPVWHTPEHTRPPNLENATVEMCSSLRFPVLRCLPRLHLFGRVVLIGLLSRGNCGYSET